MTLTDSAPAPVGQPVPRLVEQFEHGLDAPICLTWELTYACNLACVHCLSSSGKRDPRELSTQQCKARWCPSFAMPARHAYAPIACWCRTASTTRSSPHSPRSRTLR